MKEINDLILKEKNKKEPNKEYIQWLQQLSDKKELTDHFVQQVKQHNFLEKLDKETTIEFGNYFKYSGKVEEDKKIVDKIVWKNRMVDRLRDYMEEKDKN
tara:strand:- start:7185 stop:7484 length:300 start_codon:yes stop_codon:yes gene_type:complete